MNVLLGYFILVFTLLLHYKRAHPFSLQSSPGQKWSMLHHTLGAVYDSDFHSTSSKLVQIEALQKRLESMRLALPFSTVELPAI